MYFILILDDGKRYNFNETCTKYTTTKSGLTIFKDENNSALVTIPTRRVAAIVRSDCKDFCYKIIPEPISE